MWWFLFFIVAILLLSLSKAEECYHCGSRKVVERSGLGIRGICSKCLDNHLRLSR